MKHRNWSSWLFLLAVVISVTLVGCQSKAQPASLVYGLTLIPSGIDPHIHASSELGIPLRSVYDTLVYLDPDTGVFVPGLATEWTVSEDGRRYTFKLRTGVRFHDGSRFDAQAVKFNLERVLNPETGSQKARYMVGSLRQIEVPDELTVVLDLAEPYAPLLDSLSQVYLGMASPTAVQKWGNADYQFHQVGTGPYRLAEYVPGDHLTLTRYTDYDWGPSFLRAEGRNQVGEVVFRFYQDPATRAVALESGQAHVMGEIPPQDAARIEGRSDLALLPVPIPGQPLQLFINSTRPPTDELAVRRALIQAVDRAAVVQTVFGSWSPVADGPLTAVTMAHLGGFGDMYPYRPSVAAALLDQAGWVDPDGDGVRARDGRTLNISFYYMSWGMMPEVAQMVENAWRAVGFQVESQLVAYPAALEAARNGDHNVIPFNLSGTDPSMLDSFYTSGGGFNWSKVSDPDLDAWFQAASVSTQLAERITLYQRAQQRIMEQALVMPVRDYVNLNGVSRQMAGLRYDAQGWFPLLATLSVQE